MTEFGFKIVGKDGKVIENLSFNDFDAVADYMLDAADKWYSGLQDSGDMISIERKENGEVIYSDTSSFGGSDVSDDGSEVERDIETAREFLREAQLLREEDGEDS